ncbi:MAG: tetratricopeptide repeat protein [bacterium]|nr:tetratricopeptide repeat protein [bacterium]
MSAGNQASNTKRGTGKVFGPSQTGVLPTPTTPQRHETLSEYTRAQLDDPAAGQAQAGESLPQEWEIIENGANALPDEEDILQRLDRLEKRLDAFETTSYTFLLYAKQLTDRTVTFFEDIFGLSSGDLAQIHDRLGVNFNNKGDYPRAVEAFQKLVSLTPTAPAFHKLGIAHSNNNDLQEAIESFRKAVALDSKYLNSYYKLADVYAKTENFGEAIRCLTQAVEIDTQSPESHFRLGTVHNARGAYDQAITAFNRVLALNAQYPGIYQSLGIAYEQKGEHNRAIEFFKKSI